MNPDQLAELRAMHREVRRLLARLDRLDTAIAELFGVDAWPAPSRRQASVSKRARLDRLVANMHRDHLEGGLTLAEVGRKYTRSAHTIRGLFQARQLVIRPHPKGTSRKLANGCVAPVIPLTDAQIEELIRKATKIRVPQALKQEWRHWTLARRNEFLTRLRKRIASPLDRPDSPFSDNVQPFDYGSRAAWEIVRRLNAGLTSREAKAKIDTCSQGVIYEGQLWFWSHKVGYQRGGAWTPSEGRPLLHKVIWEKANRRTVPRQHVLIFVDGNPNNLSPANLATKHRGEVAVENRAAGFAKRRSTVRFFQMTAVAAHILNL